METKRFGLVMLILAIGMGISYCFYIGGKEKGRNEFFVRVPVSFFPFPEKPTIEVEIEGKKHSLLLDLGSHRCLELHHQYLSSIQNKKKIPDSSYRNMEGKVNSSAGFEIPKVTIAKTLTIEKVPAFEEDAQAVGNKLWPDPTLWNNIKDRLDHLVIHGSIGLGAFKHMACFFDFPNREIVLAQNMETMTHDAGCSFQNYTVLPFEIEDCGVICRLETRYGAKRFILDSGATISILRKSHPEIEKAKEAYPGKWVYDMEKLEAGDHDFGKWSFYLYDFSEEFCADGILGIDFFKKHSICLDFQNRIAYIK